MRLYRILNTDEVEEFIQWTEANWSPQKLNPEPTWHPIVQTHWHALSASHWAQVYHKAVEEEAEFSRRFPSRPSTQPPWEQVLRNKFGSPRPLAPQEEI